MFLFGQEVFPTPLLLSSLVKFCGQVSIYCFRQVYQLFKHSSCYATRLLYSMFAQLQGIAIILVSTFSTLQPQHNWCSGACAVSVPTRRRRFSDEIPARDGYLVFTNISFRFGCLSVQVSSPCLGEQVKLSMLLVVIIIT